MDDERDPETYAVIGAAMRVHSELGRVFLENVYFGQQQIPYSREHKINVFYRSIQLPSYYMADFICFHTIIVELKALPETSGREKSQVLNYLKATGMNRALLLNFGREKLEYIRLVNQFKQ